jgi:hypothetical protein
MGINKLVALETEKQEARKYYNAAKAEYEREYCGFPFERLHVNKPKPKIFQNLNFFLLLSRHFSNVLMNFVNA